MEIDPLFQITTACVCCEKTFQTSRVRPSFKHAVRRDADFCAYYKNENPDFYVVRVCPHCGFASTENSAAKLSDPQRKAFEEKVGAASKKKDYGGKRSLEDALDTYKLALICAQVVRDKERIIASLLHHIAWLYRYGKNEEQERRFIGYARDSYVRVYETENAGPSDARLMYLIGELCRRLDEFNEAVRWFSRVIHDQRIMDAAMIRASREQWATLREDMLARKMELPEEMQQS
ncbi:DUF2225 domain-containing protein [Saccharibacillus sp. CPCC 101409]|uniref:DUF2225 domain-containing protein n=1 Tax=Saccharibacillus sp. CPCC 101409 TaxID=3058041 RepID=UPI002673F043|nr:DUF2225 domain-containing protein [Saccharibacillus sp. CPCC 101409]MDO3410980.1 DUF2225 domain-containing protein [Saccharibacillus sp. CPCC 101409]